MAPRKKGANASQPRPRKNTKRSASPKAAGSTCLSPRGRSHKITKSKSRSPSPVVYRRNTRASARALAAEFAVADEEMPFGAIRRQLGESLSPNRGLSYYDVHVTQDDIRCLKTEWLTDNNIAFWQEYLERETLPRFPQANVVLLRPTMVYMLMNEPDPEDLRMALPSFERVSHIFLPVNDSRSPAVGGSGTHWSLLLVSVPDRTAFHYDSMGFSNLSEARHATRRLSDHLGLPDGDRLSFVNLEDSPQQENGHDCGVYVCLIMRHLLVKRLLKANQHEKVSMSMGGKCVDAYGGRKEMLKLIEAFRKEGERRRQSSKAPYSKSSPPRIDS